MFRVARLVMRSVCVVLFFSSDRLLFVMCEYRCAYNNYSCTLSKFVIRLVGFGIFFDFSCIFPAFARLLQM